MKNTLIASILAVTFATGAYAGGLAGAEDTVVIAPVEAMPTHFLGGSVNVEVTENAAGDYVATTTLGVGINIEGLAFGGASVESVDGATFEIDEWQIGTHVGAATLSFGKQGDLFVGNDFEIVGGDTLAAPADDHESLIVATGNVAVMLGFTDITADVTDIENLQASYDLALGTVDVTAVADYNLNAEEFTLGSKLGTSVGAVGVGALVTYETATEVLAYEASANYRFATAFVNGDDSDLLQNVGAGVSYSFNNLDFYGEASYNIDAEDTRVGAGVTFSF